MTREKGNINSMDDKYAVLQRYYGHDSFRGGQEAVIDALLAGHDALCVMPTGAGKSICYQIPALMMDGVTIVISPLISLMQDQVTALLDAGVPAAVLNSTLSAEAYRAVLAGLAQGMYKLLYVAPERLTAPAFLSICETLRISLVAVDEAHCVSQWGQDFRPSYAKIPEFVQALSARPTVAAFTATATETVKADIERLLELKTPFRVTTGFDRPNLFFGVMQPENKMDALLSIVEAREGQSGIVYCATRKSVEEVCERLNASGFAATRYHAGLSEAERKNNQDAFVYDEKPVMVATNAFGMGIDKSNVSYVVHYNMPKNIESYYQEAGRAGRDGSPAACILLYSPQDVRTAKWLIENGDPNPELDEEAQARIKELDYERLRDMARYCTCTACLRRFILRYFGEEVTHGECGNCSVCNALGRWEERDITVDAQKILSCIVRMGQRFGGQLVAQVLRGAKNERISALHFDELSTYGIMHDTSEQEIRREIAALEDHGYLHTEDIHGKNGSYGVLKLTEASASLLHGREHFTVRMLLPPEKKKPVMEKRRREGQRTADVTSPLLSSLRLLRASLAAKNKVPAYVVFPDSALLDMCEKQPKTMAEFLLVNGVGEVKAERYGEEFLRIIRQHS